MSEVAPQNRRLQEALAFLSLTVVLFPVLAIGIVAGWGFLVWMWQLFTGPPPVY